MKRGLTKVDGESAVVIPDGKSRKKNMSRTVSYYT